MAAKISASWHVMYKRGCLPPPNSIDFLNVTVVTGVAVHMGGGLAWITQLAIERSYRVFMLVPLARFDPDWVMANTTLVDHQYLAVLTALPPQRRAQFSDALAPWPPEKPRSLPKHFGNSFRLLRTRSFGR